MSQIPYPYPEPRLEQECMIANEEAAQASAAAERISKLMKDNEDLKSGIGTLIKMLRTEFAWTFTLADGTAVKVEFHTSKGRIRKSQIEAFARIFSAVAENYESGGEIETTGEQS